MTFQTLAARGLRYFWRTNLAVGAGVAIAVSTLSGALVVGESVRASLRDLALSRLGRADHVVTATSLFTEGLAARVQEASGFGDAWTDVAPALALEGVVSHEPSGRRAGGVQVFGVDDRFWRLHGVEGLTGPEGRGAFINTALAEEFGAADGDTLLLRIQKPSAIPSGVLQGRRDEPGTAMRVTVGRVLTRAEAGEFSPSPRQGTARTIFVPLSQLQEEVEVGSRANLMLAASRTPDATAADALARLVEAEVQREDIGVRLRQVPDGTPIVESDAGYLTDPIAGAVTDAVRAAGAEPVPVLTYLANTIGANGREVPYSLVSALPREVIEREAVSGPAPAPQGPPPIWLSQWAADDLGAEVGAEVVLDYYLWSDADGLTSGSAAFAMAGVIPMQGLAVDRDLTPEYPGVSTTDAMADWDPPFPVDLRRIRQKDEDFWDDYRTAPKAFITIEDGQRLWSSRYGKVTSVRATRPAEGTAGSPDVLFTALDAALVERLPASLGEFRAVPVRADALAASEGTTDFGEYFTYFSFFVVVASLLLAVLFFRLGVEQRAAEIGVLGALGYAPPTIARVFLLEGLAVASAGAMAGLAGAVGYSALVMLALRTVWVGAVGTTELQVHVAVLPLAIGAAGGVVAAVVCVLWSLRAITRASTRALMAGSWLDAGSSPGDARGARLSALGAAVLAAALVAVTAAGWLPAVAGFFGSGALLLIAGLAGLVLWLRGTSRAPFTTGTLPLVRFGIRNARYRPSRSVLSAALIAAASFLIVSVGAFRLSVGNQEDRASGTGGYALIGESLVPLMHDPGTDAGRDALALVGIDALDVARFRLRPGDDASCANLYQPRNPRLLGATDDFIAEGRFTFGTTLADTDAERQNPWLLLHHSFDERTIPVIGDATSLTYALHLSVGDDVVIDGPDGEPLRLRVVGALRDSVLQSELVMSDAQFTKWFPRHEGFRVFLMSGGEGADAAETAATIEDRLEDYGMDVQSTVERLASFHRVENTYLSTFQALGGLGLILGTFGLGTVLLRNVLERRREMALLRATGYRRGHLVVAVVAESVFLLACGLALGLVCALIAIGPAYAERGEGLPIADTLGLLAAVLVSGVLSTLLATRAVATSDLLPALKNE
ncbi:MAG: ABC transporter permease [Acidimicrobiia bacterium]|nr:ABC transporter permease [Acidimicrobiia bacterium]